MRLGFPLWLAAIGAMITTAIFGAALGFPVLRLRGDYLAIATLGFGEIFRLILTNWDSMTNGPMGLPGIQRPHVFGSPLDRVQYYYLIVFFFLVSLFLVFRISRSFLGRAFRAVRDDDDAAELVGIDITNIQILAFALGGVLPVWQEVYMLTTHHASSAFR